MEYSLMMVALHLAGLLSSVESAISSIEDHSQQTLVQIEWEYAIEVNRNHPWVQSLAASLNLNDERLDNLFLTASTL